MRNLLRGLLLLAMSAAPMAALTGCPESADDDDDDIVVPAARIIGVSPEAEADDLFYQLDVWARFDVAPGADATLTVADASSAAVTGTSATEESGRKIVFTPAADLMADTTYTATMTWDSDESPAQWSFTTGPYGETVTDADGLIGDVMHLDLASATFVEPPAVGSLLQGFLADVYIIFTLSDASDLANGVAHVEGALGELDGPDIVQDTCSETLMFTAGPDRTPDTADDTVATWSNPEITLDGVDLELSIQGINATIQDLLLSMVVHPEGTGFAGGRFEGILDTRQLAGLLGDDDDPNAICDLVEKTVGVGCEECGGDNPGEFCLAVVAKDIVGAAIGGSITSLSCLDVIDAVEAGTCEQADADSYKETDDDGNPTGDGYPLCALWEAGR